MAAATTRTAVTAVRNFRIEYTGSSKLIRRICEKLNEVPILGTTHDCAYYGDRGEEAYQHSKIQGNPHGVTLEDLGVFADGPSALVLILQQPAAPSVLMDKLENLFLMLVISNRAAVVDWIKNMGGKLVWEK